jgi:monothiol glutaredoxin
VVCFADDGAPQVFRTRAEAFDARRRGSYTESRQTPLAGTPMDAKDFIHKTVTENPLVLFMKGSAQFPQCGFSGRAIQILQSCGVKNLITVNVLEDDDVRQGIKDYANWPTIPQLYVKGQFVGGSDILAEMFQNGELQDLLKQAQVA